VEDIVANSELSLKASIVKWGKELYDCGMVKGSGGNISVKLNHSVLLTPTGFFLGHLDVDLISKTDSNGVLIDGPKPTKELPMHLAAYKALPNVNAVVHLHSPYATALASTLPPGGFMPIFLPSAAIKVGRIKITEFALPGTEILANTVYESLKFGPAVLLSHHGIITTGKDLAEAVSIAYEIEDNSRLYYITDGKISQLNDDIINMLTKVYK
jgi:ribulose-5-phosphate 4-epimerase/fuculose-1-phosphate aldolase